jgi:hypothetical protein
LQIQVEDQGCKAYNRGTRARDWLDYHNKMQGSIALQCCMMADTLMSKSEFKKHNRCDHIMLDERSYLLVRCRHAAHIGHVFVTDERRSDMES